MATALLIPISVNNADSPLRTTIIFIASGVVLLSMIIGTIFIPLSVKGNPKTEYLETNAVRVKILLSIIDELKKLYKDKDIKDLLAYAMVIKKLQEQVVFYMPHEKTKNIVNDIENIYKELLKVENNTIDELIKKYKLEYPTINALKIAQLRRTKLITYSLVKQIFIQFQLSIREAKFKKYARRELILQEISLKKGKEKYITVYDKVSSIFSEIKENLLQEVLKKTTDLKTAENEIAINFVSDVYINFNSALNNVRITNLSSYKNEFQSLQMEAIQLQKYQVLIMKKLKHISNSDVDILLRDLSYNETLIFAGE